MPRSIRYIDEFFTPSGVRLRQCTQHFGDLNWLFLPGGPGIGSESLLELAQMLDVPGNIWLVDLPGDGSNVDPPALSRDHYSNWPDVLLEAPQALPNCVYVGHSTGGMYLLSVPELEKHIVALVLISTAPDSSWHPLFVQMTIANPLPAVEIAALAYESNKSNETLRDLAVATAKWNFTQDNLNTGRSLLSRMPYNVEAVEWSDINFDRTYFAKWWPKSLPTMVVGGAEDRIVTQRLWDNSSFRGANILHRTIPNAGHFPWIDNPPAVNSVFRELVVMQLASIPG